MNDDLYKVLGVTKTATQDEIKKAYHKLAHKYHPDKSGGDEKKFKEINAAYQMLSNAEKRRQYDQFGANFANMGGGQSPNWGGFEGFQGFNGGEWNINFGGDQGDFRDIFEMFFDGMGVRQKRRTYKRGGDLELETLITLEDAKAGKTINLKFETFVECGICKGIGHEPTSGFEECSHCNGRGETKEVRSTFFGKFAQIVTCKKCGGAGKIPKKICASCGGVGRLRGQRSVKIEIRPGVEDGQIIKVKGMGEAGEHSVESGDLYLRLRVKPHPLFERKGNDVYVDFSMSIIDALLGKTQEIKNLGGKSVSFSMPPGFDPKDELRIKGEGMTSIGDLVVRFEVKMPKHLSAKAKKLLEDLEEELK